MKKRPSWVVWKIFDTLGLESRKVVDVANVCMCNIIDLVLL